MVPLYQCCTFSLPAFVVLFFSGGTQHQEASNKWCCVSHLLCLDGLFTLSCLRALIECERQSVLQNPVFGHLQEVLIHMSESNQVDPPVFVLLDSCLFTCSRVVYTQASCKIIHISTNKCHKFHHCPLPLESSHYG